MNPLIVFIEGNIASGKSTFLQLIQKYIKGVQCIQEPVDKWTKLSDSSGKNILQYFYNDMEKYTYSFQSFAFLSRIILLEDIDKNKQIIFIERSVFSDKNIFAKNCVYNGTMNEIEWNLYKTWFEWMIPRLNLSGSKHVYMRCDPEISYKRLKERNRSEENNVELQYIKSIHNRHEEWLNSENSIILDANKPFRDDKLEFLKMYNELLEKLYKSECNEKSDLNFKNIKEIMHC